MFVIPNSGILAFIYSEPWCNPNNPNFYLFRKFGMERATGIRPVISHLPRVNPSSNEQRRFFLALTLLARADTHQE